MREIIGSYSGDIAGVIGDNDNYALFGNNNNDDDDAFSRGGCSIRNNYLRNDFLNINKMKIDVCTQELFHNLDSHNLYVHYESL